MNAPSTATPQAAQMSEDVKLHLQTLGQQAKTASAAMARASANAKVVWDFCAANPWLQNLAEEPAIASTTSVCLKFADARIKDGEAFAKAVAKRLEKAGVAYDIGAYRDAPAGLRIWCGSTVETADVAALMPWITHAFEAEIAAQA